MRIVWPGAGRITLALLAIIPAAMAYQWQTVTERWVLGIAIAVVLILLAQWRGLFLTTMIRRRFAMLAGRGDAGGAHQLVDRTGADARTTAVLRLLPETDGDVPLDVLASYLDRYGLKAESVRVTSRDTAAERTTWVSLTLSAAANLPALQARSEQIPLRDTAEIALRRLADHLRELGWAVTTSDIDVPDLLGPEAKERWRAIEDGGKGYVAVYTLTANDALPESLAELWAHRSPEVWTTVQLGRGGRVAAAAAIRTDEAPGAAAPLAGLVSQRGRQLIALAAIAPDATEALDAPAGPASVIDGLRWPAVRVPAAT